VEGGVDWAWAATVASNIDVAASSDLMEIPSILTKAQLSTSAWSATAGGRVQRMTKGMFAKC
jgi:hypothetical protein